MDNTAKRLGASFHRLGPILSYIDPIPTEMEERFSQPDNTDIKVDGSVKDHQVHLDSFRVYLCNSSSRYLQ